MTRKAANSRSSARVVAIRKGTTLEMIRLACPDAAQSALISESFGLPVLDSDGIRDLHEKLIVETASALDEGLGERAMQIHMQRIVGSFVGSAYAAPIWMTFRQASELGGHVRKGETSSTVIYASRFTKTETDARGDEVERDIPFLRAYGVFNVEQIEGLPEHYYHRPDPVTDPVERIESADRFFANAGADLRHGGSRAFYAPVTDHIQMPPFETFRDAASYHYSCILFLT